MAKLKHSFPKVFYDDSCNLCCYFVYFSLRHMSLESPLIFSPLQGNLFQKMTKGASAHFPTDTIIVFDPVKERFLDRGRALIFILNRFGGKWRLLSFSLRIVPLFLLNFGYRFLAKTRHRFFKKKNMETISPGSNLPKKFEKFFER